MIKTLKLLIRKSLEKYYLRKIFMLEAYHFFKLLVKYNASINTDRDIARCNILCCVRIILLKKDFL